MFPPIAGWTKTSFIDYPGHPSTLIFLRGCNLRCPYCHNPGIVLGQYELIPFDAVKDHIVKRKDIIEGAVISGGEPALHPGLKILCDEIRELGVKVKIDTNGLEPEALAECRPDYLAVDIKTTPEKYRLLGAQYGDCRERLSRSAGMVKAMGENAEVRITAAPGIVTRDDIESLIPVLNGVSKVFIQQFNPGQPMLDPACSSIKPYGTEELEAMRDVLSGAGIPCDIRG
jgi:pyruvate formate lyase activating enzyme